MAFYKGTLTPLLGIGACVSIQFAALEAAKRTFRSNKLPGQDLSIPELFVCGALAGVANTVVSGPVEHIRIRLQTQPNVVPKLYNGPLDCVKKLYQANGIAGIYKGQVSTIWRDGVGYGSVVSVLEFYFVS
jgi:solute carrier family 25 carnitine/acylcarnitine transporter 20/29